MPKHAAAQAMAGTARLFRGAMLDRERPKIPDTVSI
jgi:hypothetical protein